MYIKSFKSIRIILYILFIISSKISFSQVVLKYEKELDKAILSNIFSSDNKSIACLSADKTVKIYDSKSGDLIKTLDDKGDGSVSLSYSPDSKNLITACFDKTIKIWDVTNGKLESKLNGHILPSRCVCYSSDGNFIASGGSDNTIRIWYVPSKLNYKTLEGHKQNIRSIAFSPDGLFIASAGNDLKLKIWNCATGSEIASIKASDFPIETISYSPDGKYIATAGLENNIKIWDAKKGTLYKTLKGHTNSVYSVEFSPNGKYLASGGDDNIVKIWDLETGITIHDIKGHGKGIRTVSFSQDGKMLVTGGLDKHMKVWDMKFLSINSIQKQQKFVDKSNNSNTISWKNTESNASTSFTKQYTATIIIDNNNYNNYRLFLNKSEYSKTNNSTIAIVKPKSIINTKDNKLEISYDVELNGTENEIQFFAETSDNLSYIISKPLNVKYFDLNDYRKNARLLSLIISPKNYSDQKLNIGFEININFETENTNRFKDLCQSQQGKLFKSVSIRCPDDNKYLTRKSIIRISDSLATISKKQDIFLVVLSGLFVKNANNEISLIAPNTSLKEFEADLVSLGSFCNSLNKSPAFSSIIIDPSRKLLQYPKGYSAVESKEIFDYITKNITSKKDCAVLVVSTNEYLQLFDLLFSAFYPFNDTDKNDMIDFNELNVFFTQLYKTHYLYKGRFTPLYMTN